MKVVVQGPGQTVRPGEGEIPTLIKATSYFVLDREGNVLERLSTSGKRVLRDDGLLEVRIRPDGDDELIGKSKLSDRDMVEGIRDGRFVVMSQEEILAGLDKSKCGIGITGGGDCAGIADFLASFEQNLDPELTMLGVRNAGKGLMTAPEKFNEKLIIVEGLAAKDFEGQSSTPYGSARDDPLKKAPENTKANIRPYGFFYGTGGNDHLGLLEKIAREFPDKVVVGTFKSIDGDGWVAGRPAQMLGFNTAVRDYQRAIWAAAQNADTHNQWHVVETFGRGAGKLAYEAARRYPSNFDELPREEQRKIEEFRRAVMILVPEKPTTFRSMAAEAKAVKEREGNVVVVVSEGFMPPELKSEMNRLAKENVLKIRWLKNTKSDEEFLDAFGKMQGEGDIAFEKPEDVKPLLVEDIPRLILAVDGNDPRADLWKMLADCELAAQFGKTVWDSKLDDHKNVAKLAGISKFVMQALEKLAGADKVNQILENYEARGATPTEHDRVMGRKIGAKMAELVNNGVKGGKAVVYFEGMNPLREEPVVVDLVGVSDKNNLNNRELYPTELLQENGVFWKKEDLSMYFQAA